MTKLRSFVKKVLNANGPAQLVSYSFWGVLVAGMLWDYCAAHLPDPLLALWGAVSALVLPTAIWGSKKALKAVLLVDMVLSAIVLAIVATHVPHYSTQLIYNVDHSGNFEKVETTISDLFNVVTVVWMVLHSAYLANLIQRQELESKRFTDEL